MVHLTKKNILTINELVERARQGNDAAYAEINDRYKKMVVSLVDKYFFDSKEQFEDLLQEASIALFDAVRTYNVEQSKVTFGLYAKICVKNRLISVRRKMQTRKKAERENAKQHVVHKTSERRVFDNEQLARLYKIYSEELAPLEKAVFPLYLQGQSYRDIAKQLSKDEKSIDNAVYRMKRKLRKRL